MLISCVDNLNFVLITKKKSETVMVSDSYSFCKKITP